MELTTLALILMWLGIRIGLGLFFKKGEIEFWKAFVPIYSTMIWLKLIKKPKWWLILTFIPVVNIVLGVGMIVELMNSFGRRNIVEHVLASVLGYIFLPYIALTKELKYIGPVDYTNKKKSKIREWSEAIFFAVIAASIIRTFTIEAFQIPTSSMEGTLLRGDFLFVSKVHYGAKTPKTPLSFPFMHHSMPLLGIPAYLDWIKLPSFRFPAFQDIKNNDIVVFNYPREDYRPSDKREHYIKRCVGIAGDTLQVDNGQLIVNGKNIPLVEEGQMSYNFQLNNQYAAKRYTKWVKKMNLNEEDCRCDYYQNYNIYGCQIFGNKKTLENFKSLNFVSPSNLQEGQLYPKNFVQPAFGSVYPNYYSPQNQDSTKWTRDFYGPLWIPKKNSTIELTFDNYNRYKRVFDAYEKNRVISINEILNKYSFLKSLQNKTINYQSWNELHQIAYAAQDAHSFTSLPHEMSEWADNYKMRGLWANNSRSKAIDEFTKVFNKYKKTTLLEEIDSTENKIKTYNPKWFSENKINVELALQELRESNINPCFVKGKLSKTFTFKQDYYFMMGDNRHNSGDSRAWGFVPQDHIVGKAVFIWLSTDPDEGSFIKGLRWNRLCSFVSAEGVSNSYLWEFLIGGTLLYFANKWWKRKKRKKQVKSE